MNPTGPQGGSRPPFQPSRAPASLPPAHAFTRASAASRDPLASLNPEQRRAVETIEGPLLVLAGAGTGKTKVITSRIGNMVRRGFQPEHILAVTFTNKAAGEMRERVALVVGEEQAKRLTVGTFHAFCVKVLRRHAEAIGWPRDFTICDDSDQTSAVKGALRELRVGEAVAQPAWVKQKISLWKNRMATYDAAAAEGGDRDELVARAWRRYDEQLRRTRMMDFDDLLLKTIELLRTSAHVAGLLRDRHRYVLVDEYQDTNAPQFEILREIAGAHRNLCVVGDDDQSIYGFRGADVRKILDFERHFPGAAVVRLETNYRSTQPILDAANAVIRCNPDRHEKSLRSHAGPGAPVEVVELGDEEEEAEHVAKEIQNAVARSAVPGSGARWSDHAVLIRSAVQARAFETAFRGKAIPYVLIGGMSFFDRKEVRDVLAFVRLAANKDDEPSLLRIVNTPPRGVGDSTVDKVLAFATEHGIGAADAFDRAAEIPGVPEAAVNAVKALREKLAAAGATDPGRDLVAWLRGLVRAVNYVAEIERCYPEPKDRDLRWNAVQELFNVAENHVRRTAAPTIGSFLEEITLTGSDDRASREEKRRDSVTLMTLHAAKGLEFPTVFLVGCEEGMLPHHKCVADGQVEEERRLMYVGITRARRRLVITRAASRARFGRRADAMPSRFLFEMKGETPPAGWSAAGPKDREDGPAPALRPASRAGIEGARRKGGPVKRRNSATSPRTRKRR
ncbi:MAG: ATP-dependent DNA helicase PcrA [Planctomycetes bacterium]|nr:ATP-dependent DNA helicase PcrA [Planctomycetota bacterium]